MGQDAIIELLNRLSAAEENERALARAVTRLRAALTFYADPFGRCDERGDQVGVPDFYSEMDFGSRAQAALVD